MFRKHRNVNLRTAGRRLLPPVGGRPSPQLNTAVEAAVQAGVVIAVPAGGLHQQAVAMSCRRDNRVIGQRNQSKKRSKLDKGSIIEGRSVNFLMGE